VLPWAATWQYELAGLLLVIGCAFLRYPGAERDHPGVPGPGAGGRGGSVGPRGGLEWWRPSRNITSAINTTPSPMSTQPQAGTPLLLDWSVAVDAGAT
jgi:hypothetical protein